MSDRVDLFQREKLVITFSADGKMDGFWAARARVSIAFEIKKIESGNHVSKELKYSEYKFQRLTEVAGQAFGLNQIVDYVDLMIQAAMVLQSMATFLSDADARLLPFEIVIVSEGALTAKPAELAEVVL